MTGSGSSSNLTKQTFGDALGTGGDISSGSLTYTVTSSETDAATTTETGTETLADELSDGPSQTASYSVTTTMPDSASDWETGTETLGSGGTISSGTASFSWSVGDSLSRILTVSGIAAILSITENSTDTYGFGESGTETITTGGADAPGSVAFVWNQMGTDYYQINQANSFTVSSTGVLETKSYSLGLTNTVSSSWQDSGVDSLSSSDAAACETDTYTWSDLNSLTDSVTNSDITTHYYPVYSPSYSDVYTTTLDGAAMESFSLTDVGCETLTAFPSDGGPLYEAAAWDCFTIQDSFSDDSTLGYAGNSPLESLQAGLTDSSTRTAGDGYSLYDRGYNSFSGGTALASDSYSLSDEFDYDAVANGDWMSSVGSTLWDEEQDGSYSIDASGGSSLSDGSVVQSTLSYDDGASDTGSLTQSANGASYNGSSDFRVGRAMVYSCPLYDSEALKIRLLSSPERGKAPARHSERRWPSSDGPDSGSHKRFFYRLDLRVQPLARGVGDPMLEVGQHVVQVRRIIRATLITGCNRECVAQKYQCLQCRKPHPLRRYRHRSRSDSLIAQARPVFRCSERSAANFSRADSGKFSSEYSHRYLVLLSVSSPSACNRRCSAFRTRSTASVMCFMIWKRSKTIFDRPSGTCAAVEAMNGSHMSMATASMPANCSSESD